jgi:uncharacterized protein YggE
MQKQLQLLCAAVLLVCLSSIAHSSGSIQPPPPIEDGITVTGSATAYIDAEHAMVNLAIWSNSKTAERATRDAAELRDRVSEMMARFDVEEIKNN